MLWSRLVSFFTPLSCLLRDIDRIEYSCLPMSSWCGPLPGYTCSHCWLFNTIDTLFYGKDARLDFCALCVARVFYCYAIFDKPFRSRDIYVFINLWAKSGTASFCTFCWAAAEIFALTRAAATAAVAALEPDFVPFPPSLIMRSWRFDSIRELEMVIED